MSKTEARKRPGFIEPLLQGRELVEANSSAECWRVGQEPGVIDGCSQTLPKPIGAARLECTEMTNARETDIPGAHANQA
jgi:hypothetical protein